MGRIGILWGFRNYSLTGSWQGGFETHQTLVGKIPHDCAHIAHIGYEDGNLVCVPVCESNRLRTIGTVFKDQSVGSDSTIQYPFVFEVIVISAAHVPPQTLVVCRSSRP